MNAISYFFRCLFGLQDVRLDSPRDAREFHEAKKKLKDSSRAFSREIDQFGNLVYGMQEQEPKKQKRRVSPSTAKRARKK